MRKKRGKGKEGRRDERLMITFEHIAPNERV